MHQQQHPPWIYVNMPFDIHKTKETHKLSESYKVCTAMHTVLLDMPMIPVTKCDRMVEVFTIGLKAI